MIAPHGGQVRPFDQVERSVGRRGEIAVQPAAQRTQHQSIDLDGLRGVIGDIPIAAFVHNLVAVVVREGRFKIGVSAWQFAVILIDAIGPDGAEGQDFSGGITFVDAFGGTHAQAGMPHFVYFKLGGFALVGVDKLGEEAQFVIVGKTCKLVWRQNDPPGQFDGGFILIGFAHANGTGIDAAGGVFEGLFDQCFQLLFAGQAVGFILALGTQFGGVQVLTLLIITQYLVGPSIQGEVVGVEVGIGAELSGIEMSP